MQTEVEGIILKETPYSETSKVLQVVTREYGLVSVIAKGASSLKSNLRSVSIPFLYGNFSINYKKDKLSVLNNGKIIKLYGSNVKDIKIYAYLSYLCELTYNVLKENNDKSIFTIFRDALDKIVEGFNPRIIKNIIEFKYLDYLCITPNFDICQKCHEIKPIYSLDGKSGGFICENCYTNEQKVSSNFDKVLKRFQDVDIKTITDIKLKKEEEIIIDTFLKEYYEKYSAVYLNSSSFLNNLIED